MALRNQRQLNYFDQRLAAMQIPRTAVLSEDINKVVASQSLLSELANSDVVSTPVSVADGDQESRASISSRESASIRFKTASCVEVLIVSAFENVMI